MSYQAFRFRLEPNTKQYQQLLQYAGSCRFIFNHFLAIQKDLYQQRKEQNNSDIKFLSYPQTSSVLTQIKQEEATSWLQQSPNHSLQQSLLDLDKAIKGWLTKKTGFPRFKKRGLHDSIRFPVAPIVNQDTKQVNLPKLGWIKYRQSRNITGIVKSATVSREGHHWFISILTEQSENLQPHPFSSAISIDVGVTHFLTLSSGEHIDLPDLSKLISRITSLQQRLSHKQKGSNNRRKAQQKLSAAHRKLRNTRHDFLHKTSTTLAKNHSYIVMEDLKVTNMMRSARGTKEKPGKCVKAKSSLNRSIAQQAWSTFRNLLAYKLNWLNGELRLVDPRHTSQTCPQCLTTDRLNRKSQSRFQCISCGHTANADVNAATNILRLGLLGFAA
jgi:putative transposase